MGRQSGKEKHWGKERKGKERGRGKVKENAVENERAMRKEMPWERSGMEGKLCWKTGKEKY